LAKENSELQEDLLKSIFYIVGGIGGIFGLLQALLPASLLQPVGATVTGAIIVYYLVNKNYVKYETGLLIVTITIAILVVGFQLITRPATLSGYIIDTNGEPIPALPLVLTNSNGVDQRVITDQDGRFEIKDVPDGRYTIIANNKLIYSGEVPSGFQRIASAKIDTGGLPIEVASIVTPTTTPLITTVQSTETPTGTPLTATAEDGSWARDLLDATETRAALLALTPTITPTPTASPTTTPSQTPIPLGFPGNPVTKNSDWTPVIEEFNGVEMVLVPIGCFMMGSETGQDDEKPVNQQCIEDPFWIDRYEVTNAQFEEFSGAASETSRNANPQNPRERINFVEARGFCERKRGGHLPSEAEWEYSARGPDSLEYPWGNDFIENNVIYADNSDGESAEVGSRADTSWVGASDLAGNVREWTHSAFRPYPFNTQYAYIISDAGFVVRGGAWNGGGYYTRSSNRAGSSISNSVSDLGFRCVRDYEG
jgi:formylglycine-generating enzyme required for sulfatase activity